jgi:hypothetical protein
VSTLQIHRKAKFYRSSDFRAVLAQALGAKPEQIAVCIDALIEAGRIPSEDASSNTMALSKDAATVLTAYANRQTTAPAIVRQTDRLTGMRFQCEYGPAAMTVGEAVSLAKADDELFGVQLAKTFRYLWSNDPFARTLSPIALTIGWDRGPPNLFGLIHHSSEAGEKTRLFSSANWNLAFCDPDMALDSVQMDLLGGSLTSSLSLGLMGELMKQA